MSAEKMGQVIPFARPAPKDSYVKTAPYNLDPLFEQDMVYALTCNARLWRRVGHLLQADALALPAAKLVVEAMHAIAAQTDRPSDSTREVLQHLARMQEEGKITYDARMAAKEMLDESACERCLMSDDTIVGQLRPILQERIRKEAMRAGISDLAKQGDMAEAKELLEKADKVGVVEAIAPARHAGHAVELFEETSERLTTGVMELDDAMEGGVPGASLNVWLAGTGGGKTAGLVQIAVAAALAGQAVVYITLEVSSRVVLARAYANLFGVAINTFLYDGIDRERAFAKIRSLKDWLDTRFHLYVQHMTARVTTPADVAKCVAETEDKHGKQARVVCVDYADLLRPPRAVHKDDKGYIAAGDVYSDLRTYAERTNRWVWTGSQAQRVGQGSKRKLLGVDDVADSMGKVRVADAVVSLNMQEDGMVTFMGAKDRGTKGHWIAGPLPTDFTCARIAPITPELYALPGEVV
jgi:hypothetical protein